MQSWLTLVGPKNELRPNSARGYSSAKLVTLELVGAEKIVNGTPVPITDPTQQRRTTYNYYAGTPMVSAFAVDGKSTSYTFDFKMRKLNTTRHVRTGKSLTDKVVYVDNRVFYSEDPYGRREYMGYSASNSTSLIRRVQGNHPG